MPEVMYPKDLVEVGCSQDVFTFLYRRENLWYATFRTGIIKITVPVKYMLASLFPPSPTVRLGETYNLPALFSPPQLVQGIWDDLPYLLSAVGAGHLGVSGGRHLCHRQPQVPTDGVWTRKVSGGNSTADDGVVCLSSYCVEVGRIMGVLVLLRNQVAGYPRKDHGLVSLILEKGDSLMYRE